MSDKVPEDTVPDAKAPDNPVPEDQAPAETAPADAASPNPPLDPVPDWLKDMQDESILSRGLGRQRPEESTPEEEKAMREVSPHPYGHRNMSDPSARPAPRGSDSVEGVPSPAPDAPSPAPDVPAPDATPAPAPEPAPDDSGKDGGTKQPPSGKQAKRR